MSGATYEGALKILKGALTFGIHPSLDGIKAICEGMGRPQDRYHCIQIAGTNGKTSTARLTAALLIAHGKRTGLYTSPELCFYPERIEIDGKVVSDQRFADCVYEAKAATDVLDLTAERVATDEKTGKAIVGVHHDGTAVEVDTAEALKPSALVTEFELITAGALKLYEEEKVEYAVLECGLGGRWDATSVVDPCVAVITGIGLDHTKILGDTVEKIAGEKAAIIKPASIPVLGPGTDETLQVFLDQVAESACMDAPRLVRERAQLPADTRGATLYVIEDAGDPAYVQLTVRGAYGFYEHLRMVAPDYQCANIATAIAAAEAALGGALDSAKIQHALDTLVIPGRFETLRTDPLLIIDAAHNPECGEHLVHAMQSRFCGGSMSYGKKMGQGAPQEGVGENSAAQADNVSSVRFSLLLGVLADKDASGIIETLAPLVSCGLVDDIMVSQSDSERALTGSELAASVRKILSRELPGGAPSVPPIRIAPSLDAGVKQLAGEGRNVLATGSITVAGEVKRQWLIERKRAVANG